MHYIQRKYTYFLNFETIRRLNVDCIGWNDQKPNWISTDELRLPDGVVPALLDVRVELPGEDHHVLFRLQGAWEKRRSGWRGGGHTGLGGPGGPPTSYWEVKLKDRLMELLVTASAVTEGGGRAAAGGRVEDGQRPRPDQSVSWSGSNLG